MPGPTSRHFISQRLRMHYVDWGNPDAPPLLLVHGGRDHCRNWDWVAQAFRRDWNVICPDLRGHGRSTNPSRAFTFRQAALDVFALLDHLGIARTKAIGLSMGAKTLLHMATQQRDRIEAMVLVSATPYFPAPARAAMAQLTLALPVIFETFWTDTVP